MENTIINGIEIAIFILGNIGLISALFLISSINPIHRIVFLILIYLMGAFNFMFLDFPFLGLTYIIVYVGAIAILFLFVIMMVQISDKSISNDRSKVAPVATIKSKVTSLLSDRENYTLISNNNSTLFSFSSVAFATASASAMLCYATIIILFCIYSSQDGFSSINNLSDLFNDYSTGTQPLQSLKELEAITGENNAFIGTYFHPIWMTEYLTITDLISLGYMIYIVYPIALVILAILLWVVLIGIISICTMSNNNNLVIIISLLNNFIIE